MHSRPLPKTDAYTSEDAPAVSLSEAQRLDWLRLIRTENVGPRTFRTLLARYGDAGRALSALPELARRGGAARAPLTISRDQAERELNASRRLGITLVALTEAAYPHALRAIHDAPPLLGVRGKLDCLARPALAVVGARNASGAGRKFAEHLARVLGQSGLLIVSGLARGIDAAAHRGSLATGTVAVLAGGHDRIYPPEHSDLVQAILEHGACVSEMPLGWEPRGRDFPRRNRLISGLSLGVLVVEAARRSGSLLTARMALDQGREVLAVPGGPLDPRTEGSNGLLKDGAVLVTTPQDALAALGPMLGRTAEFRAEEPEPVAERMPEPGDAERNAIVELLGPTPVTLDDLVRLSGASAALVRSVLLELDVAGRIDRRGDGLVALQG